MEQIVIAIDGYSSCGKSTLAKRLARELNYIYVDTGAMYRAVTLYFLDHQVDYHNPKAVESALSQIDISFEQRNGENHTILNGVNVEQDIRTLRVSREVSPVAAISAVRRAMVAQQRKMGAQKGVVMDGRDIGTVVFPDAELKLFVTADVEERTDRRYKELRLRGEQISRASVQENLEERDRIDSSRSDSPLRQAADAIVLDNSNLNQDEQAEVALELVHQIINSKQ